MSCSDKGKQDIDPAPSQALFQSMVFYLFPKPTAAVMKIKTSAFARYGAKVWQVLDESVTHVLVNCPPNEVPPLVADGPWHIVNEKWASDSIDVKRVLDISAYRPVIIKRSVSDAADPIKQPESPISASSSESSQFESPSKRKKLESPAGSAMSLTGNDLIIEVFQELASDRKSGGNSFSSTAYLRAIKRIETSGVKLKSYEDAQRIGLSPKLSQMVDDICSGRIPESIRQATTEKSSTLHLFQTLYGVGPKVALDFYTKGYRTLDDIRENVKDENIKVSLEHHADFIERISRVEVDQHYNVVKTALAALSTSANALCMGSYRRGQPDCGDIDIIVTKPGKDAKHVKKLLAQLVVKLFETGLAKHTFGGGSGSRRWLGATELPGGKWRRMDLLAVPDNELGASLIYYTGNDYFNRKLRLRASRMGMRLNERGLFDRDSEKLIESHDEKRIFSLLKTAWREPEDRNID